MLTKCMLTPLKLARLMEWNGRLGKPSAVMAVDITNHHIGIALAYHRQHAPSNQPDAAADNPGGYDTDSSSAAISTTTITALPPIPYMSSDPYHPSYAFLHHHRPDGAPNAMRSLDRVQRTMEVADQLAQLAMDRQVKGVLVRWPGDLASAVSGGNARLESLREAQEGHLLLPLEARGRSIGGAGRGKSDGSMGYLRGRILYVLDMCCTSHGHARTTDTSSEPLLVEGTRPFALFDTSVSEQNWISYEQQNKGSKPVHPRILRRQDKYGNSLTEMDLWGRAAIFGNEPPNQYQQQGQFYYSSKQQYPGYRVSSHFGTEGVASKKGTESAQQRNDTFDSSLHDNESRLKQFQGSLSAMHALYDFARENLQGRIALPRWASTSSPVPRQASNAQTFDNDSLFGNRLETARDKTGLPGDAPAPSKSTVNDAISNDSSHSNLRFGTKSPAAEKKKPNGLATLVPIPKRASRRRGKRG